MDDGAEGDTAVGEGAKAAMSMIKFVRQQKKG